MSLKQFEQKKEDAYGNYLRFEADEDTLIVYLFLKFMKKEMRIGDVTPCDDNVTYRRCIRNNHIVRKDNSVGFNETVIDLLNPTILTIKNMETRKRFKISRNDFERKKYYLNFKKQGYENQVLIKLEDMEALN